MSYGGDGGIFHQPLKAEGEVINNTNRSRLQTSLIPQYSGFHGIIVSSFSLSAMTVIWKLTSCCNEVSPEHSLPCSIRVHVEWR